MPGGDRAGDWHGGDEGKLVAAHRDQSGFQAAFGAEAGDTYVRVVPPQRIGEGEGGLDMTGRPAAS